MVLFQYAQKSAGVNKMNNSISILDTVGNTPLVKVAEINGNTIFGKLEYFNPTGSVKDRAALYIVRGAIERGELKDGGAIIEATSGNTGIGLALVGKSLGYPVVIVMPENMSKERIALMRGLGAEVVLTDKTLGMNGAVSRAKEIQAERGGFIANQFANKDNVRAHFEGTAPEIFKCVQADIIVAGVGSGGTAVGIKKYIIHKGFNAQVVAVQPSESPLLTGGKPAPHGIQGIGANFVPELYDGAIIDAVESVTSECALNGARELGSLGILGGISAGANYVATKKIAEKVKGKNIVFIVPDSAMRYLSMGIYDERDN